MTSHGDDPDLARGVDRACRLAGTFTLRSGQVASERFDEYLIETDPGASPGSRRRGCRRSRRGRTCSKPRARRDPPVTVRSSLTGRPALRARARRRPRVAPATHDTTTEIP